MVQTYEAIYDGGVVRLPSNVRLPEHTKVYVVVPEVGEPPRYRIGSPHLLQPQQAVDFVKEVIEEDADATVR